MKKQNVIAQDKLVSCLPGFENFDTESISNRRPRVFQLKSIKELRMEKERKAGKIRLWKDVG